MMMTSWKGASSFDLQYGGLDYSKVKIMVDMFQVFFIIILTCLDYGTIILNYYAGIDRRNNKLWFLTIYRIFLLKTEIFDTKGILEAIVWKFVTIKFNYFWKKCKNAEKYQEQFTHCGNLISPTQKCRYFSKKIIFWFVSSFQRICASRKYKKINFSKIFTLYNPLCNQWVTCEQY